MGKYGNRMHLQRHRFFHGLLLVLLLSGLLIRLHGIFVVKAGLTHDESVSYLCAAATQHHFEVGLPEQVDLPLTVGDIHAYYAVPDGLQFRTVARDLVLDDIHPPLYFWALHVVHRIIGYDLRSGPLLNLAATLFMLVVLFRLGRELLGGTLPGLACCTIWFLSPAVVQIDLEARHYQLFGLIALCMFAVGRRLWKGTGTRAHLLLFTVLNALGFLTHYYYGFLLIPGALLMLQRWGFARRTFLYITSLFVSLGLFLIAFPDFLAFVPHYLADREAVAGAVDHGQRARALLTSSMAYLSNWKSVCYALTLLGAMTVILAMARARAAVRQQWALHSEWLPLHLHLCWYFLFTALLYVGGISPEQAIGGEYFAYFWPLLALAIVNWAMVFLRPIVRRVGIVLFGIQLLVACWSAVNASPYVSNVVPMEWVQRMSTSDMLYTNEGRRGYLPRLAIQLPGDLPLRISSPEGLEDLPQENVHALSYWLVLPRVDSAPPPFVQRVKDAGFVERISRTDKHELRYFVRAE